MKTLEKIRYEIQKYLEDECINEDEAQGIFTCIGIIDKYAEQNGWEEMTVPCKNCGHDMTFKIAIIGEPCEDAYDKVLEYLKANVDDFPDYHEAIEAVLEMKGGE